MGVDPTFKDGDALVCRIGMGHDEDALGCRMRMHQGILGLGWIRMQDGDTSGCIRAQDWNWDVSGCWMGMHWAALGQRIGVHRGALGCTIGVHQSAGWGCTGVKDWDWDASGCRMGIHWDASGHRIGMGMDGGAGLGCITSLASSVQAQQCLLAAAPYGRQPCRKAPFSGGRLSAGFVVLLI